MIQWPIFLIFMLIFALVAVIGFRAAYWRRGSDSSSSDDDLGEWALAGRRLGTIPLWLLMGGNLFTAYTYVAVPALLFSDGAIGFYAIPYTALVNLVMFTIMPRYWKVCATHGYVTPADFVRARFGSRLLALATAITGILATIPYIALQMYGVEVVLRQMGVAAPEVPMIFCFMILSAYTYVSGMRASILVAIVKAALIAVTVVVVFAIIPAHLGGFATIFAAAGKQLAAGGHPGALLLSGQQYSSFSTLALGSILALFLYPHVQTSVLSARDEETVRRCSLLLPIFSLILTLLALMGYAALAAGIQPDAQLFRSNVAFPALLGQQLPVVLAGIALAAIAIGALVPAAIMSMACANLFTRNCYREYIRPNCDGREEANVARLTSLVVKVGALAFVIFAQEFNVLQQVISFQQLGGVWILQTLPAVFLGLYLPWLNRRALALGWAISMALGTWMVVAQYPISTSYRLPLGASGLVVYAGFAALIVNLAVIFGMTGALSWSRRRAERRGYGSMRARGGRGRWWKGQIRPHAGETTIGEELR